MIQKTLIASVISLVMLSGCSDNNSTTGSIEDIDGSGNNANNIGESNDAGASNTSGNSVNSGPTANSQTAENALQQFENSDAFYAALRAGIIGQNQVESGTAGTTSGLVDTGTVLGDVASTSAGTSGAVVSVSVSEQGGSVESAEMTGTNVQEVGINEYGRMKSDGEFLYILENQYFENQSDDAFGAGDVVVDLATSANADTTAYFKSPLQRSGAAAAADREVVDFAIESLPDSPISETGFSIVGGDIEVTSKVRILALQNDVPDAVPVTDLQLELDGGAADGMYLFSDNAQRNLILTSTSYGEFFNDWDDSYSNSKPSSLISKLDVTNPSQAGVAQIQSVKIDGQIISSRRIDDKLFIASSYYPVPKFNAYTMSLEEYEAAISDVDLTQMLPKITSNDGVTTDLINPAECFAAVEGPGEINYLTPDIVSMAVIDLKTLQLKDSECFLGYAEKLYATPNSVYLAATRWDYAYVPSIESQPDDSDSGVGYEGRRLDTEIHQFAINGAELTYSGSGMVSGHLGYITSTNEPYRMSEKDGYLRVATVSEMQYESESSIRLTVLDVAGDGELVKVSELPNANFPEPIGMSGEQMYASRFIGDRLYLDTFRQTEPFYVIDISDPAAPQLAGELEIDGYSDYLQPIGENHVLGIGRNAVPGPVEWGESEGVKLSLFNVADANNPTVVQSVVIGERGTETAALHNHRAITIQPATDLHPTRLAFGIEVHGLATPRAASSELSELAPWNYSGLHGFDINIGSGAGIEPRGAMVVNSGSNPQLMPADSNANDRSVIVGDAVYYINGSEVFSALWSDLGNFNGPR